MTEFNGYKLKPVDYKFQVGDILIRVKNGDEGELALVTSFTPKGNTEISNSNKTKYIVANHCWKAIATLPGSQAKASDTVYCISDTGGSCNQHDLLKVKNVSTDAIYVEPGQKLLRAKTTTEDGWNWSKEHFVVLVKAEQPKYKLNKPKQTKFGWEVYAGTRNYLRQDLTVQEGLGIGTPNSGYWPTEADALAARAKYLGESVQPDIKIGSHWERIEQRTWLDNIIRIDDISDTKVVWGGFNKSLLITDLLKNFKPKPELDNQIPEQPEIKIGSHWERIKNPTSDTRLGTIIQVSSVNTDCIKWGKSMFGQTTEKFLKRFKPRPDLDNQVSDQSENNTNQQTEKQMPNFNLTLLIQFLAAQAEDKVDATNAKHIGILAESDGTYTGYVYANTLKELQDIVRKPENEGRKLHIFDYNQTIAQKARPVTQVSRV